MADVSKELLAVLANPAEADLPRVKYGLVSTGHKIDRRNGPGKWSLKVAGTVTQVVWASPNKLDEHIPVLPDHTPMQLDDDAEVGSLVHSIFEKAGDATALTEKVALANARAIAMQEANTLEMKTQRANAIRRNKLARITNPSPINVEKKP